MSCGAAGFDQALAFETSADVLRKIMQMYKDVDKDTDNIAEKQTKASGYKAIDRWQSPSLHGPFSSVTTNATDCLCCACHLLNAL